MSEHDPNQSDQWDSALRAAFGTPVPDDPVIELPSRDVVDLPIGNRVGRLELVEEVARGGVGVIWRAHDADLGRDVAVKVLKAEHGGNADLVRRFIEEAQIGGQLQHPGIVPVHEIGLDADDRPYFAMKLVEGRTMRELLDQRDSDDPGLPRLVSVFQQVCQTVAYAHARGVVHRDLKPANIMVGAFGEVQVMDWGFAKVIGDDSDPESSSIATVRSLGGDADQSVFGSAVGTPGYMAPEQASGAVDAVDARSDVFGLGAILCHILTGRPPYAGGDAMRDAAEGRLTDARHRLATCGADPELVRLAQQCLRAERAERPRDAGDVAVAVADYLDGVERRANRARVEAAAADARARSERRSRRRIAALSAVTLVATLVAGGVLWWTEGVRDRQLQDLRAAEKNIEAARAEGDLEQVQASILRAVGLAEAAGLDQEVQELLARRDRVAREIRDDELQKRLLRIRTDLAPASRLDRELAEALSRYGVDPESDLEDLVGTMRELGGPRQADLARAAEQVVFRYLEREPRLSSKTRRWLRLADLLDQDPARTQIRAALRAGDIGPLEALAGAFDPETTPLPTSTLLGKALRRTGRAELALETLALAEEVTPVDLWLQAELTEAYLQIRPPDFDQAQHHATLAAALHPQDDWDPMPKDRVAAARGGPDRGPDRGLDRGPGRGGPERMLGRGRRSGPRGGRGANPDQVDELAQLLANRDFEGFAESIERVTDGGSAKRIERTLIEIALTFLDDGAPDLRERLERLLR